MLKMAVLRGDNWNVGDSCFLWLGNSEGLRDD